MTLPVRTRPPQLPSSSGSSRSQQQKGTPGKTEPVQEKEDVVMKEAEIELDPEPETHNIDGKTFKVHTYSALTGKPVPFKPQFQPERDHNTGTPKSAGTQPVVRPPAAALPRSGPPYLSTATQGQRMPHLQPNASRVNPHPHPPSQLRPQMHQQPQQQPHQQSHQEPHQIPAEHPGVTRTTENPSPSRQPPQVMKTSHSQPQLQSRANPAIRPSSNLPSQSHGPRPASSAHQHPPPPLNPNTASPVAHKPEIHHTPARAYQQRARPDAIPRTAQSQPAIHRRPAQSGGDPVYSSSTVDGSDEAMQRGRGMQSRSAPPPRSRSAGAGPAQRVRNDLNNPQTQPSSSPVQGESWDVHNPVTIHPATQPRSLSASQPSHTPGPRPAPPHSQSRPAGPRVNAPAINIGQTAVPMRRPASAHQMRNGQTHDINRSKTPNPGSHSQPHNQIPSAASSHDKLAAFIAKENASLLAAQEAKLRREFGAVLAAKETEKGQAVEERDSAVEKQGELEALVSTLEEEKQRLYEVAQRATNARQLSKIKYTEKLLEYQSKMEEGQAELQELRSTAWSGYDELKEEFNQFKSDLAGALGIDASATIEMITKAITEREERMITSTRAHRDELKQAAVATKAERAKYIQLEKAIEFDKARGDISAKQLKARDVEIARLQGFLETARKEASEGRESSLELALLKGESSRTKVEIETLQTRVESLTKSLSSKDAEIQEHLLMIEELEGERDDLAATIEEQAIRMERLSKGLSSSASALEGRASTNEKETSIDELDKAWKGRLVEAADEIEGLQARLTSQDAVLIKAQAEVSRLSNVETDLQTRLADVGKAQKATLGALDVAKHQIGELRKSLASRDSERESDLAQQLTQAETARDLAMQNSSKLMEEKAKLDSSLLELDNAQLEMKQVNIDLTRKIESLKQQLKDDRLEINQLKLDSANTTDALKQEIKDKSRELDAKVKELDDIAAQLATATTDLAAATADLKAYTTVSDAENLMRQTKEVLVGRIKRLEREIKMCREGIQSMSIERRFEGGLLAKEDHDFIASIEPSVKCKYDDKFADKENEVAKLNAEVRELTKNKQMLVRRLDMQQQSEDAVRAAEEALEADKAAKAAAAAATAAIAGAKSKASKSSKAGTSTRSSTSGSSKPKKSAVRDTPRQEQARPSRLDMDSSSLSPPPDELVSERERVPPTKKKRVSFNESIDYNEPPEVAPTPENGKKGHGRRVAEGLEVEVEEETQDDEEDTEAEDDIEEEEEEQDVPVATQVTIGRKRQRFLSIDRDSDDDYEPSSTSKTKSTTASTASSSTIVNSKSNLNTNTSLNTYTLRRQLTRTPSIELPAPSLEFPMPTQNPNRIPKNHRR